MKSNFNCIINRDTSEHTHTINIYYKVGQKQPLNCPPFPLEPLLGVFFGVLLAWLDSFSCFFSPFTPVLALACWAGDLLDLAPSRCFFGVGRFTELSLDASFLEAISFCKVIIIIIIICSSYITLFPCRS